MDTPNRLEYEMPTLYDEARDRAAKGLAQAWHDQWCRYQSGTLSEAMYGVGKRYARKELQRLGHHRVAVDRLGRVIEKVRA